MRRGVRVIGLFGLSVQLSALGCAGEAEYIRQGEQRLAAGRSDAALEAYFAALAQNPDSGAAHRGVGEAYIMMQRYAEAETALARAAKLAGDGDLPTKVSFARLRHAQKRYADAAALYREVLQADPEVAALHRELAAVQVDAGDLQRAVESFQTAVMLEPDHLATYLAWANALKRLHRFDEAVDVLTNARKELPGGDLAEVQCAFGEVYEGSGMLDFAQHSYRQALKRSPELVVAARGLARVLRRADKHGEAIELLQGWTQKRPQDAELLVDLGLAYWEYHLFPQAATALLKAMELEPSRPEAYPPLLDLLDRDHLPAAQRYDVLNKAAKALPDDGAIQLRLCREAHARKDDETCLDAAERAIEVLPANVEANFYRGLCEARSGDLEGAQASARVLQTLDSAKAAELMRAIDDATKNPQPAPAPSKAKRKPKRRR